MRVLVVDDDRALLESTVALLERAGFEVEKCTTGAEALEGISRSRLDAVISDIAMPGITGIELLSAVRRHDVNLPVIMVTGEPSVSTAVRALELGAFRYLLKPVEHAELVTVVRQAAQLNRLARAKHDAFAAVDDPPRGQVPEAELRVAFDNALGTLWPAFQPIIDSKTRQVFGYEALLRTNEPSLPHPGAVLETAERFNQLPELFRCMRARSLAAFQDASLEKRLFLNLHPVDLHDDDLLNPRSEAFQNASRIILEVTERATLERMGDVKGRVAALRDVGYRIAVDDLGAGYAGLTSFATLEPEFVKLDMALIRDIDKSSVKQRLVRVMAGLCRDMNMLVVAEGIETYEEHKVVLDLGCDLLQGFRYGRPERHPPV
jgi:EAL domain-containing protein (putative c-di-GMP-specific phosphodiesterase class I)/CheY-like chemotaxis protein